MDDDSLQKLIDGELISQPSAPLEQEVPAMEENMEYPDITPVYQARQRKSQLTGRKFSYSDRLQELRNNILEKFN